MLKIRLKRTGRKSKPFYRIVLMENLTRRDGAGIVELGYYDPLKKVINFDKIVNMTDKEIVILQERKQREKYGRFWLWENYSNPLNEPKWLENAERLKHVNDHVI